MAGWQSKKKKTPHERRPVFFAQCPRLAHLYTQLTITNYKLRTVNSQHLWSQPKRLTLLFHTFMTSLIQFLYILSLCVVSYQTLKVYMSLQRKLWKLFLHNSYPTFTLSIRTHTGIVHISTWPTRKQMIRLPEQLSNACVKMWWTR